MPNDGRSRKLCTIVRDVLKRICTPQLINTMSWTGVTHNKTKEEVKTKKFSFQAQANVVLVVTGMCAAAQITLYMFMML